METREELLKQLPSLDAVLVTTSNFQKLSPHNTSSRIWIILSLSSMAFGRLPVYSMKAIMRIENLEKN